MDARSLALRGEWEELRSLLDSRRSFATPESMVSPGRGLTAAVADEAAVELGAWRAEADDRTTTAALRGAMEAGAPRGAPGALDLTSVSASALSAALTRCGGGDVKGPGTAALVSAAHIARRLRSALTAADWVTAASAIAAARDAGVFDAAPEFALVRADLARRGAMSALRRAMAMGGVSGAPDRIVVGGVNVAGLDASIASAEAAVAVGAVDEELANHVDAAKALRSVRAAMMVLAAARVSCGGYILALTVLGQANELQRAAEIACGMRDFVWPDACAAEICLVVDAADHVRAASALHKALSTGGARVGASGDCVIDPSCVETGPLVEAVAVARRVPRPTAALESMIAIGADICALRTALLNGDDGTVLHATEQARGALRM